MKCFVYVLLLAGATAVAPGGSLDGAQRMVKSASEMSPADALERIAALRAEIAHHDDLYFRKSAPEISDFDYDQLKAELGALEHAFPEVATRARQSASAGVPDDRTGRFPSYRHGERMLSLDKTYAESDVRTFLAGVARKLGRDDLVYVVEPKVDGIAISVTFDHGKLVRAVTRGNGVEGDDITENVRTIDELPDALQSGRADGSTIPVPELIELRGEVYLPFAEFERLNREREAAGEEPFANPRNAAAGTARLTDARLVATRGLAIVFYGVGACEPSTARPVSQQALHASLREWGLPAFDRVWVARNADEVWRAIGSVGVARKGLAFPTDGAVVKLDDVSLRPELGESEQAPRWAIAFKYAPARAETRVTAITIQVGRTGVLTPVAELDPVSIAGSTVTRATMHNRDVIARMDLRVGDFVYVEKAGEIIPAIVGVDLSRRADDSRMYEFPHKCPGCGAEVVQARDDATVRCTNPTCPAQLRRRIEHFASVSAVNIDGLGPATIEALVGRGWVKTVADLYHLRRADLLTLGENVETSTDSLMRAIELSKDSELWRFIYGLGIPRVGEMTARELAAVFPDLTALADATPGDFGPGGRAESSGLGRSTVDAILTYFAEPRNKQIVREMVSGGVRSRNSAENSFTANPAVAGKIFVLTGRLPHLMRDEATRRILAAGGKVNTSVSRRTDYVVAGADAGAKLNRAHELGITVIDEAGLLRMLDER